MAGTEDLKAEMDLDRLRAYRAADRAILEAIASGYVVVIDGRISEVSEVLCKILGFSREELIGATMPWPFWPADGGNAYRLSVEAVGRAREAGRPHTFELPLMRKDGTLFIAEVTTAVALDTDGLEVGWVNTITDVSSRRDHEAELERLANHDPLTGLANRRLFDGRLEAEMANAVRYGRSLAVAILDLDHFKHVNDRFGHPSGDRVLREAAQRLLRAQRSGDLLARVGGEEFAWILPEADARGATAAAERARLAISDVPFDGIGPMTISVGVSLRGELSDAAELYENADRSLYQAKRDGRNRSIVQPQA